MSSRWQMAAAAVSIALMVVVLVKYGVRDDPTPETKPSAAAPAPSIPGGTPLGNTLPGSAASDINEPHAGTVHHTEEAPPHEGTKPVPLDVFAHAKVGDWHAFESVIESTVVPKPVTSSTTVTLTAVDPKQVVRTQSGEPARQEQLPRQGLTLDQLTVTNEQWTIYDVAFADEVHEVGGRSFKCKKISFTARKADEPHRRNHTEIWLSDEVPAGGLVEYRSGEGAELKLTRRLVGFGDAKTTRWGKKPAR